MLLKAIAFLAFLGLVGWLCSLKNKKLSNPTSDGLGPFSPNDFTGHAGQ